VKAWPLLYFGGRVGGTILAMDAFGASRVQVRAPERGVFPLDHDGECKDNMKTFLSCLKEHNQDYLPCKQLSKAYLACRMEKELMMKESLDNLGFKQLTKEEEKTRLEMLSQKDENKELKGFVAGTGVAPAAGFKSTKIASWSSLFGGK
jgi:cytochrome c oxidase assembly protein subunit 19